MNAKLSAVAEYLKKIEDKEGKSNLAQVAYALRELVTEVGRLEGTLVAIQADALYAALCTEYQSYMNAVKKGRRSGDMSDLTTRERAGLMLFHSRKDALAQFDADETSRSRWPEVRALLAAAQGTQASAASPRSGT